jgi:hypothetical protein
MTLVFSPADRESAPPPALAGDAVRQWLDSPATPPRDEPVPLSYRLAAEEAVRCFQEIVADLDSREVKEAYIHLLVGRGFAPRQGSSTTPRK